MKRQRTAALLIAAALTGSVASGPPAAARTVRLPLADFEAADPRFAAHHLASFRLVFERDRAGVAWIAEVGLASTAER